MAARSILPLLKKFDNLWVVLALTMLMLGFYLTVLFPWMNHWGMTAADAGLSLPGDSTYPELIAASTRGVTVKAPAAQVWQWVVQLGADQAGFYSNDWLENLFLADIHNAAEIHPEWQTHRQGEPVYGAAGAIYQQNWSWPTVAYEEGKMIYLWGPVAVLPVDDQTSRLIVRTYAGPTNLGMQLTYDWMHFVMERGMLLGIKARAEGRPNANRFLNLLGDLGWILVTLGIGIILFVRRHAVVGSRARRWSWAWGLIPLAYAGTILVITRDLWAAMAGFLWWGIITAGFLLLGRAYWKWLILTIALVILVFVLFPQPHLAFGIIFLVISLGCLAEWLPARIRSLNGQESLGM
jgi:hypothetical protein